MQAIFPPGLQEDIQERFYYSQKEHFYYEALPQQRKIILREPLRKNPDMAKRFIYAMEDALIEQAYFESGVDFWELYQDIPAFCKAVLKAFTASEQSALNDCVRLAFDQLAEEMAEIAAAKQSACFLPNDPISE